ncbi:MAG: flagellar hook-basal body complex protein FliE [Gammaproteobacteria bacterium]|nr:flagellar hook-basal body complex protein FliE [Gammaproteobacteria bacterium]
MSNSIDSNVLLAQLRTMAAQAGLPDAKKPEATAEVADTNFTEVLKHSVNAVNDRQQHAASLAESFERGEAGVELSQVMIEMQKARISFETLSQVRNKAVSAYQEIMNMSI